MEKTASPPSDPKAVSPQSKSPPQQLESSPPSTHHHAQQFATDFTTLYHSIFPPKPPALPSSLSFSLTPSSTSSASATDDTEYRLQQASLILEYQELCDHYDLCLSRLQSLSKEIDSLRQENADLRLVNNDLLRLLSISSIHNRREIAEPSRFERRNNTERVMLPKSISVRSSGYLKLNPAASSSSTRPLLASHNLDQLISGSVHQQQRVRVAGGGGGGGGNKREEAAVEMEVYNQGMWKTELCNKWQETGMCPYGDHCQFAHGITELRPVIRHPRYKTQVCRMVVAGEVCPYGHRCHFRHSLSDQERLITGPR
ncbi:zinc finger CCCH domain-containing protein 14 isoform X2 [Ricinus communis]|uniref:Zinc finger protein, putative n=1 Tax=Ricinus communis TaxID=3988 RepID=B9SQ02_RICCO|nr:zinc finger CCCH domain-containing protein 14 isoform X2 [Ricinus communis]EEF34321.1 zinc finger protein, putative [Ricinus communis]|eukprot:XP_002528071.1 zinc finger CCCH domain-containing protein 14 isoform X2 [Ricinus communis]